MSELQIQDVSKSRKIVMSLLIFFSFCALLCSAEILSRLVTHRPSQDSFYTFHRFEAKSDEDAMEADPHLGWRLKSNLKNIWWDYTVFSTNSRHYRHPREILKKTNRQIRMVCLGDSVPFGFRVPVSISKKTQKFDDLEAPFPFILEENLRFVLTQKEVEVIDMGVPGYTTFQGLRWLEREYPLLNPDLVVIHFGFNDTEMAGEEIKNILKDDHLHVVARWVASKSQFFNLMGRGLYKIHHVFNRDQPRPEHPIVSSVDYIQNILAMVELCRRNKADVIVLGQVYRKITPGLEREQLIVHNRQLLAAACLKNHIFYLEIPVMTEKGYPGNLDLFGEDIHPSSKGHEKIAEELLDFLSENKILAKWSGESK